MGLVNSEHIRDGLLASPPSGVKSYYLNNVGVLNFVSVMILSFFVLLRFFRRLGLWIRPVDSSYGVPDVLRRCAPLKVVDPVVSLVSVNVVSNRLGTIKTAKCKEDQAVDIYRLNLSVFPEIYAHISAIFSVWINRVSGWAFGPRLSSDSSETAGGIYSLKSRDCPPLLSCGISFVRHFQPFSSRLLLFRRGAWLQPSSTPLFLILVALCASLFSADAANPSYQSFRGTGGISIVTNPPTGTIVIDGSGIFTSSGTNATVSTATNGTKVNVAATNINFIWGRNIFLRATNNASSADVSINVQSNLIFSTTDGGVYYLGAFGSGATTPGTNFGIWDASAGIDELSLWRNAAGKWIFAGPASMSALTIRSIPGSGSLVAVDGSGDAYRTNSVLIPGALNVATNNVKISGLSTQLNLTAGNNIVLRGTNTSDKAGIGIGVESNLTFYAVGGDYMVGTDANGAFGISNKTTGRWSIFNAEPSDDAWIVSGTLSLSNVALLTIRGSGNYAAIDSNGSLYRTNASASGQGASDVLTNLVGTVANNVTNFISLSTSNATSKPLTNSYSSGVVRVFGLEAGANVTVTPNGSNLVIAASASGGGLATNNAQFGANTTLNIKDGALVTNVVNYGKLGVDTATPLARLHVTNAPGTTGTPIFMAGTNATGAIVVTSNATVQLRANAGTAGHVWAAADTAGTGMWTNNAAGFSVSGVSNQVGYLDVPGTGFVFGGKTKTAPGFGFQPNGGSATGEGGPGALIIHADKGEDVGLVQIGTPNPSSFISTFIPSLSVSNIYAGDGSVTQEMVRVNYADFGSGSHEDSYIQTWRSWQSTVAPASTLTVFSAGLHKSGMMRLAHGTYYPSNSFNNDGFGSATLPSAAYLGPGGFWTGLSNQSLVTIYSLNGSTTAMKVLAP